MGDRIHPSMGVVVMKYNGWANRETWNVALWIGQDMWMMEQARLHAQWCAKRGAEYTYSDYLESCGIEPGEKTPDGISWRSPQIDRQEIKEFLLGL